MPRKKWADMSRQERQAYNLRRFAKAFRKTGDLTMLRTALYQLDWMQIVRKAVEGRPTSFGLPNGSKAWQWPGISEWRNASDEILMAFIQAIQDAGIVDDDLRPPPPEV